MKIKKLATIVVSLVILLAGCDTRDSSGSKEAGSTSTSSQVSGSSHVAESSENIPELSEEVMDLLYTIEIPGYELGSDGYKVWWKTIPDEEEVTVITEVAGIPIYGIDTEYQDFENLKSLTIPSGIQVIEDHAFSNCETLTSLTVEEGLTNIGYGAFRSCTNLTAISLADSITTIGGNAFYNCSIQAFTLPKQLKSLGAQALISDKLEYVTIEDGVNYKEKDGWIISQDETKLLCRTVGTYKEENKLQGEYSIPEGIIEIGASAFSDEDGMTAIKLPSTLKVIGDYAFCDCDYLQDVKLPITMDYIGDCAFANCDSLEHITLPPLSELGEEAFRSCYALQEVDFLPNDNPFTIEAKTFHGTALQGRIELPEGTVYVGSEAFSDTKDITLLLPDDIEVFLQNAVDSQDKVIYQGSQYSKEGTSQYLLSELDFSLLQTARNAPETVSKIFATRDLTKCSIELMGVTYHIGDPVQKFLDNGWVVNDEYDHEIVVKPNDDELLHLRYYLNDKFVSVNVTVYNSGNDNKNIQECLVIEISPGFYSFEEKGLPIILEGFNLVGATSEEITKYFGNPDEYYYGHSRSNRFYHYSIAPARPITSTHYALGGLEFEMLNSGKVTGFSICSEFYSHKFDPYCTS